MNALTKNIILFPFNILYKFSPELTLKALFLLKKRKKLDLKNPKTFNEKINWLNAHYIAEETPDFLLDKLRGLPGQLPEGVADEDILTVLKLVL